MTGGFLTAPGTAPAVPKRRKEPRSRTPARRLLGFGPAFIAAVAYVDPGNFATNFTAGSRFGYQLLWVVVAANLIAVLVQMLAAKLGLATGRDLATLCRERYPRPVVLGLWLTAELVAMATDLAEVVGGVIALNLLFDVPHRSGRPSRRAFPSCSSPSKHAASAGSHSPSSAFSASSSPASSSTPSNPA